MGADPIDGMPVPSSPRAIHREVCGERRRVGQCCEGGADVVDPGNVLPGREGAGSAWSEDAEAFCSKAY